VVAVPDGDEAGVVCKTVQRAGWTLNKSGRAFMLLVRLGTLGQDSACGGKT
jgi:hypothetical protein